nr:MAG TPA: hypothetical protein [Caudoviricetes sp.]
MKNKKNVYIENFLFLGATPHPIPPSPSRDCSRLRGRLRPPCGSTRPAGAASATGGAGARL